MTKLTVIGLLFLFNTYIHSETFRKHICIIPNEGLTAQSVSLIKAQEDLIGKCLAKDRIWATGAECRRKLKCMQVEVGNKEIEFYDEQLETITQYLRDIRENDTKLSGTLSFMMFCIFFITTIQFIKICCPRY